MSFGNKTHQLPQQAPVATGRRENRVASNERGKPVKYLAGTRRFAADLISPIFKVVTYPVRQEVGKDDSIIVGHEYHASWAMVLCSGPLDILWNIIWDDIYVWGGPLRRSGHLVNVTIPNRGIATLYWGTDLQPADAWLNTYSGNLHPAYRGFAYLVFKEVHLGYNKSNLPNVEVIASRFPEVAWLTSSSNSQGDANPMAVYADLLQNPRVGPGLADAKLDTASLNSIAAILKDEGVGLSPLLTEQESLKQISVRLGEYFDGAPRQDLQGRFSFLLNRQVTSYTGVPSLDESGLLEPPEIDNDGFEGTHNKIMVKYNNRAREHLPDALTYIDQGNFLSVGEIRPLTLEREWVTRARYARQIAVAEGRVRAQPQSVGKVKARKSKVEGLLEGGVFLLSFAHFGICNLVCRAVTIETASPWKADVEITFYADFSGLTVIEDDAPAADAEDEPSLDAEAIPEERLIEAPGLLSRHSLGVLFLATRANQFTPGLFIHHRQPSGSYGLILSSAAYALRGTLSEAYPATTELVDEDRGFLVTLAGADTTLISTALQDSLNNEFLAFIGDEILGTFNATLVSAGVYRVFAIRERFDTVRAAHASGAEVWLMARADLPVWQLTNKNLLTQAFKLQSVTPTGDFDISEIEENEITLTRRADRPLRPQNLRVNGLLVEQTFSAGASMAVTWTNSVSPDRRNDPWDAITTDLWETELDIMRAGGVVETIPLAAGVSSYTYSDAARLADLDGLRSFSMRIYHVLNGLRSANYSAIELTLV